MSRSTPTPIPDESLAQIEARLFGTLKRVAPPKGLTQRLRDRVHLPESRVIAARLADWRSFFIAFGGALSGLLLFITIARALFHLFGRRQL
jgi:hypothetical protein